MDDYKRGFIQTDLDAIVSNFNILKSRVSDSSRMLAVIKADGYGHGAVEIAKTLEGDDSLWGFAVASADEAIELGDAGISKPILILGYVFD
ncbi:MAG: alanine racemase, partial [Lachnospiraceae bacterium]|nr:alanine racemase [Lachnospiraceae bacterium]